MRLKIIIALLFITGYCKAQSSVTNYLRNLDRRVNLDIKQQPISEVLNKMSKAGDFYFSYTGSLFKQDSIVNLKVKDMQVRDILDRLFNGKVDYKETGQYIILRYAANHLTIEPENITSADKLYIISGYVIDTETGKKIKQASVYEKRLLQSTLTDNEGYFRLRFKGEHTDVTLTASKDTYRDTSLVFLADITVKPEGYKEEDSEQGSEFFNSIENSGISRFFISSKQRMQSLNIPDFFANTPFQASLTPGLSTHGIMSSQVINKVSLNILGGYTAGTDGVEVAGVFNITKGNVKKLQVAGVFNGVGGSVDGVQVAGVLNDVRTSVKGVQVAGLLNHVKDKAEGFQIAGLANVVSKDAKGMQVAGLINVVSQDTKGFQIAGLGNLASKNLNGMQIAGLGNITSQRMKGTQIAGLFNYAKEMDGFQIGIVNISGKSDGYSLGLINFVKNGYHKLSFSTNETINANVSFKMGNAKLYNIILAGKNFADSANIETAGLGFGHDFIFSNRFSVAAEITSQYLYLGNWDYSNFLHRFQTNLQIQLVKGITVFGGPVYSIYSTEAPEGSSGKGYKQNIAPAKHDYISKRAKGWIGWNVGITIM
ncbi:STN and carboxypeptidase regulatory-like domain-containing protein [Pedobacter panaciterrae]|uniref:STN and carboxypeptidase regulatory-like domain-containing protein n=1 Tax=Pedobacter panaciterrae TaxID=363849 RepID=UPI003F694CD8